MNRFFYFLGLSAFILGVGCSGPVEPPKPKGIFVGDLKPLQATVGWGDYMVNEYPDEDTKPVLVDGKKCAYFLFTHANSDITYPLPPNVKRFTATGIRPSGDKWIAGTFAFEVMVDGKSLFKSKPLREYPNFQVPITVEIPPGAQFMDLKTDILGGGFGDHSIWANPFLE